MKRFFYLLAIALMSFSCDEKKEQPAVEPARAIVKTCTVDSKAVKNKGSVSDIKLEGIEISVVFNTDIDLAKFPEKQEIMIQGGGKIIAFEPIASDNPKELKLKFPHADC